MFTTSIPRVLTFRIFDTLLYNFAAITPKKIAKTQTPIIPNCKYPIDIASIGVSPKTVP